MFRSTNASRPGRSALVLGLLTALALTPAATAFADDEGRAPVLDIHSSSQDITAPVLDINATVSSLDGSVANQHNGRSTRITLAADVLFAFDKAELNPTATSRLRQTVVLIQSRLNRGRTSAGITVDGYTDSLGTPAYNQALSERRAASVKAALTRLLGAGFQVGSTGHGAADPIAANNGPGGTDNPAGRALNRRVTVSFRG